MRSDVRIENEFLRRLHIVQQATTAESRQDIKERRSETADPEEGDSKSPLLEALLRLGGWSVFGSRNLLEAQFLDLDELPLDAAVDVDFGRRHEVLFEIPIVSRIGLCKFLNGRLERIARGFDNE